MGGEQGCKKVVHFLGAADEELGYRVACEDLLGEVLDALAGEAQLRKARSVGRLDLEAHFDLLAGTELSEQLQHNRVQLLEALHRRVNSKSELIEQLAS